MGHSTEVDRINELRSAGYYVCVIRERPVTLTLTLVAENAARPEWTRRETLPQSRHLYVRSELEEMRVPGAVEATFSGRGGCTTVRIEHPEHGLVARGEAHCRKDEPFSKKQGLRMALGRALKDLSLFDEQAGAVEAINAGAPEIDSDALHAALAGEVLQGRA